MDGKMGTLEDLDALIQAQSTQMAEMMKMMEKSQSDLEDLKRKRIDLEEQTKEKQRYDEHVAKWTTENSLRLSCPLCSATIVEKWRATEDHSELYCESCCKKAFSTPSKRQRTEPPAKAAPPPPASEKAAADSDFAEDSSDSEPESTTRQAAELYQNITQPTFPALEKKKAKATAKAAPAQTASKAPSRESNAPAKNPRKRPPTTQQPLLPREETSTRGIESLPAAVSRLVIPKNAHYFEPAETAAYALLNKTAEDWSGEIEDGSFPAKELEEAGMEEAARKELYVAHCIAVRYLKVLQDVAGIQDANRRNKLLDSNRSTLHQHVRYILAAKATPVYWQAVPLVADYVTANYKSIML